MEGEEEQQQQQLGDVWREIQGANSWEGLLDPMNPILRAELLRYGDFAQLCYDADDRKRAERLLFQESDNLRDCGYEITRYIYANIRKAREYIVGKSSRRSYWIGFIAVCIDETKIITLGRRDIVVAWKGTTEGREWIQNLKDITVPHRSRAPPQEIPPSQDIPPEQAIPKPDVRIEKGFLGFYVNKGKSESECSPKHTVEREIRRLLHEYRDESLSITFTGHSLGGALATLSAYYFKQMHSSIPVTVFAFASPRVGNEAFAQHMQEIGVNVLRVVIKGDLVPKVPGLLVNENKRMAKKKWLEPWSYFHVGTKLRLDSLSSPYLSSFNPFKNHKLNAYLHLIDGFRGTGMPSEFSPRGKKYYFKLKNIMSQLPVSSQQPNQHIE